MWKNVTHYSHWEFVRKLKFPHTRNVFRITLGVQALGKLEFPGDDIIPTVDVCEQWRISEELENENNIVPIVIDE